MLAFKSAGFLKNVVQLIYAFQILHKLDYVAKYFSGKGLLFRGHIFQTEIPLIHPSTLPSPHLLLLLRTPLYPAVIL